jgi:PAS domain S-box-containing protein
MDYAKMKKAQLIEEIEALQERVAELEHAQAERKRVEEALRESEERYRAIFEQAADSIVLVDGETGALVEFNDRAHENLGYTREEFQKLKIPDFEVIESAEEVAKRIEKIIKEGADTFETKQRKKDGEIRDILVSSRALSIDGRDFVQSIWRDITERKRMEDALRRREQEISTMADNAPALVSYVDADGHYRFVNKRYEEWFGVPRTEIVGKHYREVLGEATYEQIKDRVEAALSGRRVTYEDALPYVLGGIRWVLADYVPDADDRGKVNGFFALVTDITERKRAEEALQERTAELTRSNALIAALGQVAARLQTSFEPDQVMETLGAELKNLGLNCIVALLEPDSQTAVICYISIESSVLTRIERLTGLKLQGLRIPRLPIYDELVEQGHAVFAPNLIELASVALPGLPRPVLKRALRLGDARPDTPAFYLPLKVEDRVFGILNMMGDDLREDDLPAVSIFASQVAVALENARLFEQVQAGRERLRLLTQQVVSAQEEERKRISQELHDELGQALTAIGLDLAAIKKELPPELAPKIREKLAEASALADQLDEQVSEMALDLRPYMLDDLGLVSTLRWYVNRYARRLTIEVEMEAIDFEERVTPEVETALYRVVQEALTNVARHSQANRVSIRLERKESTVAASIEDDGQGFDVEKITGPQAPERGAGLVGIRERVDSLGGTLSIQSRPGQGTELTIEIPA